MRSSRAASASIDGQPQPIVGGSKLNGQAGKQRHRRAVRAHRRGRRRRRRETSWSGAGGGGSSGSRTSARSIRAGPPTTAARLRHGTPAASTFGWRRPRSWATGTWRRLATGSPTRPATESATARRTAARLNTSTTSGRRPARSRRCRRTYDPAVGFTPRREYRLYGQEHHLESAAEDPPPLHPPLALRPGSGGLHRPPEPQTVNRPRPDAVPPRAAQRRQLRDWRQPELRAPRRAVRDLPRRRPAGRLRLRVHALPGGSSTPPTSASWRFHPEIEWGSFFSGDRTEVHPRRRRAAAPRRAHQHHLRVQPRVAARGPLRHSPAARGHRHAVQPVHVPGEQRPVRFGEPTSWAGRRASAGLCGRATTCSSSTRTTGSRTGSTRTRASAPSTGAARRRWSTRSDSEGTRDRGPGTR